MNDNERILEFHICDNIVKETSILHIPIRNWIEAIAFVFIVGFIISLIPFTSEARTGMLIIYCGFSFYMGLKGIKNRSVTEAIIDWIRSTLNRRKLHLRGPEYAREKKEIKQYDIAYASYARRKYYELREKLVGFAEGRIEGYSGEADFKDDRK